MRPCSSLAEIPLRCQPCWRRSASCASLARAACTGWPGESARTPSESDTRATTSRASRSSWILICMCTAAAAAAAITTTPPEMRRRFLFVVWRERERERPKHTHADAAHIDCQRAIRARISGEWIRDGEYDCHGGPDRSARKLRPAPGRSQEIDYHDSQSPRLFNQHQDKDRTTNQWKARVISVTHAHELINISPPPP
jgi:hypothetical protein